MAWRITSLTKNARLVEEILWLHMNFTTHSSFPSQDEIVKQSGISRSSVIRSLKLLERKNIIRKTHIKSNGKKQYFYNEYFLLNYVDNRFVMPDTSLNERELDDIIDNYFDRKRA